MGRRKTGGTMLPRNTMAKRLPPNVTKEIRPNGSVRYRFRKTGLPRVELPGRPGSPEFERAYALALLGKPAKKAAGRAANGTLAALVVAYRRSPKWDSLSPSTRQVYSRILDRMTETHGHRNVAALSVRNVRALHNSIESPHSANRYLSILRILMDLACADGWRDDNPCRDVRPRPAKSKGIHSWTDAEIAKFLSHWGAGTRERLAMLLLLDTGQRPSDVCVMGRQHMSGDTIQVRQKKTGAELTLWLGPQTMAEIKRAKTGMTLVLTQYGKPFTAKGFQQWFSRACTTAGLPHCSAHGLRKARARMLAERGATTEQIKSITGHRTTKEVDRYVRAASQKRLAQAVSETVGALDLPHAENGAKTA